MILSFDNDLKKFENTGNKSYNLAKINSIGISVPKFICITKLDCQDNLITSQSMNRLLKVIKENFEPNTTFAVRTSSNLPNVDGISCSEQFETLLNVSLDSLESSINQCLGYVDSKRVNSYIKRHNIATKLEINVIIQEMLPQDICGVAYTSNPTGILSERVVMVGKGNCNDIYNNRQNFNTYYFNADGNNYLVKNVDNLLLMEEQLEEIHKISDIVQHVFKHEVRLDFCIYDDTVYILQVDTLDTLKIENVITLNQANMPLDNFNTTYPLTISFIKECHEIVFDNLILHLTNSQKMVQSYNDTIHHIICSYNGRIFYNINNLYTIFSILPFSDIITPVLEKEFDTQDKQEIHKDVETYYNSKIDYIINMLKILTSTSKKIKELDTNFNEVEKIFNDCYCEELSDIQLKSLYKIILSKTISKWDIDIINSISYYFNNYIAQKFLKKEVQEYSLEASKKNREKLYNYIQKIFIHMGLNLVNLGYIENENDVYYLTVDELFNEGIHSYKDLVSQRKSLYDFYNRLPNYKVITFNGKVLSKNPIKNGEILII